MVLFQCDYTEGAHPKLMERLMATNMEQWAGYGEDAYCEAAADKFASPAMMRVWQFISL